VPPSEPSACPAGLEPSTEAHTKDSGMGEAARMLPVVSAKPKPNWGRGRLNHLNASVH
jgi:hypothetical protein